MLNGALRRHRHATLLNMKQIKTLHYIISMLFCYNALQSPFTTVRTRSWKGLFYLFFMNYYVCLCHVFLPDLHHKPRRLYDANVCLKIQERLKKNKAHTNTSKRWKHEYYEYYFCWYRSVSYLCTIYEMYWTVLTMELKQPVLKLSCSIFITAKLNTHYFIEIIIV